MADTVLHRGSLSKWKSFMKWSAKQFVLTNETFSVYSQARGRSTLQGCVHVKDIVIVRKEGGVYFDVKLSNSGTVWYLKAPSLEEKLEWIEKLQVAKNNVLHHGCLKKFTNVLKGWQRRYFVLYTDRLCYYLSQDHLTQRRGTLMIVDREINITTNPMFGFDIHGQGTTWFLRDEGSAGRDLWVSKIEAQNRGDYHELEGPTKPPADSNEESINEFVPSPTTVPGPSAPPAQDQDSDEEACYRKDLECGICIDLLIEPTSLNCGHTYCLDCLANWWLQNRDKFVCPLCRCKIDYLPAINVSLQNLLLLLFETEIQKRNVQNREARTEEREIFDKFWESRRVNGSPAASNSPGGENTGGLRTNTEFEFLKRGMWLIFVLWVLGRCVQNIIATSATIDYIPETPQDTEDMSGNFTAPHYLDILSTPGSTIFVLVGMMFCPRVLLIMSYIFWYPTVFHPIVQEIANATYQYCGFAYELKVVTWGSVNPYVWFVPFSLIHNQFLLCLIFLVRSFLEFWWLALELRALIRWPTTGPRLREHLIKTVKELWTFSAMNFAFVFAISLLPWNWLPDVMYNSVLLVISTILLSRTIVLFRTLVHRTQALRLNWRMPGVLPGVMVTEILMNRAE